MYGKSVLGVVGAALALSTSLTGCGKTYYETGTVYWGSSNPMVTTASVRTILQRPSNFDPNTGLNRPSTIVCAEPSPDVAVAVGDAFGGSLAADVRDGLNSPGGATPLQLGIASSVSRGRAEAIAQLGERLATMQLLRDGLYRACEAYANGAISSSTYAVMVGGIDDLVVTLLAEEMAAGAFGRSFSTASSGAAASSMATMLRQASEAAQTKLAELKTAEAAETDAKLKLTEAERKKASGAADAPSETELQTLRDDVKTKTAARQKAQGDFNGASETLNTTLTAQSDAQAWGAATGGGEIKGRSGQIAADAVQKIAAHYIDDQGIDALMIACISELSRMRKEANGSGLYGAPVSELGERCRDNTSGFFAIVGLRMLKGAAGSGEGAKAQSIDAQDIANFKALLIAHQEMAADQPQSPARLVGSAGKP